MFLVKHTYQYQPQRKTNKGCGKPEDSRHPRTQTGRHTCMILKLAAYPTEQNGWKFFDGVKKLDYQYEDLSTERINKIAGDDTGMYELDCFITGHDHRYCGILFTTKDGIEHRIITGLPVYLCNDEGKTIEVINR